MNRFAVAVLGMAFLSWSASANARFTYSFSDAAQSTVDCVTRSVMPKRACAALQTGASADVTIASAATIAAANGLAEHPQVANFNGTGSTDDAASFTSGAEM